MAPENWFPIPPTREDRYLDEMISVPLIEEPIGQVSLSRREWRRPFSEIIMRHFGTKNAIDRMCDFLGECLGQNCTRKDLAARLGVSKEELEEVEDKGVIPDRWLLDMVFMVNANPYWLITGQGTRRLRGNPDDANSYYPVGGEEIAKPGSEIRAGKNGFS